MFPLCFLIGQLCLGDPAFCSLTVNNCLINTHQNNWLYSFASPGLQARYTSSLQHVALFIYRATSLAVATQFLGPGSPTPLTPHPNLNPTSTTSPPPSQRFFFFFNAKYISKVIRAQVQNIYQLFLGFTRIIARIKHRTKDGAPRIRHGGRQRTQDWGPRTQELAWRTHDPGNGLDHGQRTEEQGARTEDRWLRIMNFIDTAL